MIILNIFQRLAALLSLAVLVWGGSLVWSWWELNHDGVPDDGYDYRLYLGLGLLAFSLLGKFVLPLILARGGAGQNRARRGEATSLPGPRGESIHVETFGPEHAPRLVFTHGWGMDSTFWCEAKRDLAERFRVVVWDLPGLGRSKGPADGHYDLDRYADCLKTVLDYAGGPAVLVGHSIGGMITQTFCLRHHDALGARVAGVVLENTTYAHAHRTTIIGGLLEAIRRPILEPLMRIDIVLSPLMWLMAWQSYLSGSTHLAMRLGGFGTQPTRAQLDQVSRLTTKASPAVQAKGNLAMMRWSVADQLPSLRIPALIFVGGRDIVTIPDAGEWIAGALGAGPPVRIDEVGHMGPLERAGAYNGAIAAFADRLFKAGAIDADRRTAAADEGAPVAVGQDGTIDSTVHEAWQ